MHQYQYNNTVLVTHYVHNNIFNLSRYAHLSHAYKDRKYMEIVHINGLYLFYICRHLGVLNKHIYRCHGGRYELRWEFAVLS